MAKKRKTRKAANAVPKRIAGLKVPKALRRGQVGRLLASPAGQALIVSTVTRASEHAIGRETRPSPAVRRTAASPQETIPDPGEGASENSAAFIHALRQAARAFVAAMQAQQTAVRAQAGRDRELPTAGRDEERREKKEPGERPDRRTAH